MGALFRSEEMSLVQLFIQPEAAYHIVAELGESGCVQFKDLNDEVNLFQREYSSEVKRINEMERQIHYIEAELKNSDIKIHDISELPKAPNPREIVNLESHLDKTEKDIKELSNGANNLKKEYYEKVAQKYVLSKAQSFYLERGDSDFPLAELKNASQLDSIAGVLNKEKIFAFEKLLFRIAKGNIYVKQADIDEIIKDPVTGVEQRKTIFIAFFQGAQLGGKIRKICTGYKATIVDIPEDSNIRNELVKNLSTAVQDFKNIINQTEDHRNRLLISVAKDIQNWRIIVCKLKAIYDTLNLFSHDVSRKCFIAEGWVPTNDLSKVQNALSEGSIAYGSTVPSFYNTLQTKQTPPTFNRTNKFTRGFQNLISAYAFSTYRELNPALYTIITFPFLFAIMFGDLGHGIIMACFGAWLVISEKKLAVQKNKGEIFDIFFGGRYIILLMGIFSMYTGLIYNDIFSKSMNLFGSKWKINVTDVERLLNVTSNETNEKTLTVALKPLDSFKGSPYLAGLDPVWQDADNKIIFLNSFKMKLSIIFGVVHMIFGVCLSIVNFVHFKKRIYILLDFLPKILFFAFLFIYLIVMIFMKWINYTAMNDDNIDTAHGSSCAPNVLIFFIGMMLFKKSELEPPCDKYMYEGQEMLQHFLLVFALLCIPWMLFGVPIYEMMSRKKHKTEPVEQNGHASGVSQHEHEEEEEPMSELMVHAGIHTIEFTLSTVSHTASYLRLWALSLAHAQLSDVLWDMVFRKALVTLSRPYLGGVFMYIIFFAWSSTTVAILVLMEGLSAFLHTLRLHWVEFMTKFFKGEGYEFHPFSFKRIFEDEEEGGEA